MLTETYVIMLTETSVKHMVIETYVNHMLTETYVNHMLTETYVNHIALNPCENHKLHFIWFSCKALSAVYINQRGRNQTLWKGGVPAGYPSKRGVLGHYLPFFVTFAHENDKFSNKKGGTNPMHSPSWINYWSVWQVLNVCCHEKYIKVKLQGTSKSISEFLISIVSSMP